jgi:hypothetical protein
MALNEQIALYSELQRVQKANRRAEARTEKCELQESGQSFGGKPTP